MTGKKQAEIRSREAEEIAAAAKARKMRQAEHRRALREIVGWEVRRLAELAELGFEPVVKCFRPESSEYQRVFRLDIGLAVPTARADTIVTHGDSLKSTILDSEVYLEEKGFLAINPATGEAVKFVAGMVAYE